MDRTDVILLIRETYEADENGVEQPVRDSRPVFVQVNSITRSEFFEAGRSGLNPEFMFSMFFGDYAGETIVEYAGKRYAVYRTYRGRNDTLEVYVQREGGTNGKENSHC